MSSVAADPALDLLAAVRAVEPCIRAHADAIERERRIVAPVVDALHERGLFRMLLPAAFGGHEVDPIAFAHTIEVVATIDASTAWCLCQASGCSMIAAYLDPRGAGAIFGGDPRGVIAWGQPPNGRAVTVDGGYRVTARWQFASGSHHATWLGGVSPIFESNGQPNLLPDGTHELRTILVPVADAELLDVWHVSGLRGTGSDTIVLDDRFVPRVYTARQHPDERRESGPLYRLFFNNQYAAGFSSVAQGIARGMLDAFIDLATTKSPRGVHSTLRENAVVQSQVGRAEAVLGSARAYLHATLDGIWREVVRSGALTLEQRVQIRLASTFGIHQALEVADTLYHAAGSSAILASHPFERRFRDIHAVAQQVQGRQAHFETVGQFLLGLDPDKGFV